MTDAEKNSLAKAGLDHFPKGADVKSAEYEKQVLLFEQIVNDPNMKVAEKKAALDAQLTGAALVVQTDSAASKMAAPVPVESEVVEESMAVIAPEADLEEVLEAEAAMDEPAVIKSETAKGTSNFSKKS